MQKSFQVTALLTAAFALSVAGCRCDEPGPTVKPGELSIVFDVDGVSTSGVDAVYDFGQVYMGTQKKLDLTIKNTGTGSLFIDKVEKDSGDAVAIGEGFKEMNPFFIIDYTTVTEVRSGEVAKFSMTFDALPDPDENVKTVKHLSKLRVLTNNAGGVVGAVTLKGEAVSGVCTLPRTIDFGAVARGQSFNQSVTLTNASPLATTAFVGEITSNGTRSLNFTFAPESSRGEVALAAGQSKKVTITFSPTEIDTYVAIVKMRAAAECPEQNVRLIGNGVDTVLSWSPGKAFDSMIAGTPVDFGYVTPNIPNGTEGYLTFANLGFSPVALSSMTASSVEFKVIDGATMAGAATVPPSTRNANGDIVPGTLTLTMSFKPTLIGPRTGVLRTNTDVARQPMIAPALKGYGGGPDIDVKPAPVLSFGRVGFVAGAATPTFVTRKLTIQNAGAAPTPPDQKANLHLGVAGMGTQYFTVEAKQGDASEICIGDPTTCDGSLPLTGPGAYDPMQGIEARAGRSMLDVAVRITPKSIGTKEFVVTVYSNDPDEPEVKITVRAEAVLYPPCRFSLAPAALNFGLVTPPDYKDLNFVLKNLGQQPEEVCLLSNLDLAIGSDPVFTLPAGPITDKELMPNEAITVTVRAWPQGTSGTTPAQVMGAVRLNISSDVTPEKDVPLNAAIATGCLTIAPHDLDFGTVKKDCNSFTRQFAVYNTCDTNVTVQSFQMVAPAGEPAGGPNCPGTMSCPEFILVSSAGISPGTVITPANSTPNSFSVKYHPINYGPDNGAFLLKVTQSGQIVDYLVTLRGNGDTMGINTDTFKQDTKPKADILLVIDDSCSMDDKQNALSQNFDAFIKYASSAQVDYHIGVTTTDMGNYGGRILGDASNPKVLTPTTPDVENKFRAKVKVGIGGGTEESAAPSVAALTAPLITADNQGLLRPDAFLAVVVVTDAGDQSALATSFYQNALLNIKGLQRASQFSYNVIGPFAPTPAGACTYDDFTDPSKHLVLVQATNGVKEEICTPDWAKSLEQIGKNAFGYRTNFFLTARPDTTTVPIEVKVDGQKLDPADTSGAKVWVYDSAANSVNFEPLFVPEPGRTLTITYQVACMP
ncbi:MAG: choice-of-anchor D domain-containing protein [Myxococcaceae bacterium]|nr:choice-of-anchor D domain-containing protein [Myxococcaceae bacterium]